MREHAQLTESESTLLRSARRGVLATTAPSARPRLVPIAYVACPDLSTADSKALVLYSALDEKPKSVNEPLRLARVRDVLERPQVSVLVDRWSEDWTELSWLRLEGTARVLQPADKPEHALAVDLLRERYPQYLVQRLEKRPILRIQVTRAVGWDADA